MVHSARKLYCTVGRVGVTGSLELVQNTRSFLQDTGKKDGAAAGGEGEV